MLKSLNRHQIHRSFCLNFKESFSQLPNIMDQFRPEYKFYKKRPPSEDFSSVIDFYNGHEDVTDVMLPKSLKESSQFGEVGLRPLEKWRVHGLRHSPGFYLIRNPFLADGQRSWIRRCLIEYPRQPYLTNVDANLPSADISVWDQHIKNLDKSLLSKLRWVTLGYHHNWVTKEYDFNQKIYFPDELRLLAKLLVSVLGFNDYFAQAAIVNFYHMDSSLGGHIDHSELDHSLPLVSISFGQKAVFLLGGPTKETKPQALYLRSGDVVIMSGPCRMVYHGVPLILPTDEKPWGQTSASTNSSFLIEDPDSEWTLIEKAIDKLRINLNVRQVCSS